MPQTILSSSFAPPAKHQTLPSGDTTRKRGHEDDQNEEYFDDSGDSATSSEGDNSDEGLSAHQIAQYRIAGLKIGKPVPDKPFPHAKETKRKSRRVGTRHIQRILGEQNPRFHVHRSLLKSIDTTSVRSKAQHINNLTTLFYRCFLQGLIPQAYRAFLLLLAAMPGTYTSVTYRRPQERLRVYGYWALATELIMKGIMTSPDIPNAPVPSSDRNVNKPYSQRNLHLARQFLEMLVLQYPLPRANLQNDHRKYTAASALEFYNTLFSVWVYEISQGQNGVSPDNIESTSPKGHLKSIKEHASQLVSRLDMVLGSIEYSIVPQLLELRGHVELWLGALSCDLLRAEMAPPTKPQLPDPIILFDGGDAGSMDIDAVVEGGEGRGEAETDTDNEDEAEVADENMDVDHGQRGKRERDGGGDNAAEVNDESGDITMATDDDSPIIIEPHHTVNSSQLLSIEALHRARADKFFIQAEKYGFKRPSLS